MLARVFSATTVGIKAIIINIEVDISRGLPAFNIVGLPDKAVRESRERVRAAITNSGFEFPIKKITINMAPADIKKIGPHFDLAIAVGILATMGKINSRTLTTYTITGELALDGTVRKIKGVLPMASAASKNNFEGHIIPIENYREGALVKKLKPIPVRNLKDVVNFFNQGELILLDNTAKSKQKNHCNYNLDFSEIKGQQDAIRAMEIAAAGSHNILMVGPPGAGKTMLAQRIRTILPPLSENEALELTKIYSITGNLSPAEGLLRKRPFRAPHQNISAAGLIGGGRIPKPGEISLAHRGTLFLDELPEFRRDVLDMLRQPLEEGSIKIIRKTMSATFPADFMLIAAMNPCPCGYYGDKKQECSCTHTQIKNYRSGVSGPLLDRIDMHIEVPALKADEIMSNTESKSSKEIRERVIKAHKIQLKRFKNMPFNKNSELGGKELQDHCQLEKGTSSFLKNAINRLGLSARAFDRILKLARTIADLEGKETIKKEHLAEAIQYRTVDI